MPPMPIRPHAHSLLEATCEIVKATPDDAGRLFGAFFVKVGGDGQRGYRGGADMQGGTAVVLTCRGVPGWC